MFGVFPDFPFIVTTSHSDAELEIRATAIAEWLKVSFIPRQRRALATLREEYGCSNVLVVERQRLVVKSDMGDFFFHPNMAVMRIHALKQGHKDPYVMTLDIHPGDQILDCTLGLGADAIVASFVVGESGLVTGIEHSPLIAVLVKEGLKVPYGRVSTDIIQAMQRIKLIQGDHRALLNTFPDGSFDTVYFDPMFRRPVRTSSGIQAARFFADYRAIEPEVIEQALRVSRRRVVMKESKNSSEWQRLKPQQIVSGENAPVSYGIWQK